jgi:hypothetical protein
MLKEVMARSKSMCPRMDGVLLLNTKNWEFRTLRKIKR